MMPVTEKLYGAAGTGKTSTLIQKIIDAKNDGIKTNEMIVCTFSVTAAKEIRDRMNISKKDFPLIGTTIHSMCFHLAKLNPQNFFDNNHAQTFCTQAGLPYKMPRAESKIEEWNATAEPASAAGNQFLALADFFANTDINPVRDYHKAAHELRKDLPLFDYLHYLNKYEKYKTKNNLFDYADMLKHGLQLSFDGFQFAAIDEAQDLCPTQIKIAQRMAQQIKQTYLAGDDDQTIYNFRGARAESFLYFTGQETVLPYSYRNPQNLIDYNASFLRNLQHRKPKKITSKAEYTSCEIITLPRAELETILRLAKGKTFFLTRTNYQANTLAEILIEKEIPFNGIERPSPFTLDLINQYNALHELAKRKPKITTEYFASLIAALPSKQFLKQGAKKQVGFIPDETISLQYAASFFALGNIPAVNVLTNAIRTPTAIQKCILQNATLVTKITRPNIYVGTKHSAKGKEADTVVNFLQVPKQVEDAYYTDGQKDDEIRLNYVTRSRVKQRLIEVNEFLPFKQQKPILC